MNEKNSTDEEKELESKNERSGTKEEEDKHQTLRVRNSGRQRTKKNKKPADITSKLYQERHIISVKQLKRLVKKKTPVFLAVI